MTEDMTDEQAAQLLDLLCRYFECYPSESANTMTVRSLAADLWGSMTDPMYETPTRRKRLEESVIA